MLDSLLDVTWNFPVLCAAVIGAYLVAMLLIVLSEVPA